MTHISYFVLYHTTHTYTSYIRPFLHIYLYIPYTELPPVPIKTDALQKDLTPVSEGMEMKDQKDEEIDAAEEAGDVFFSSDLPAMGQGNERGKRKKGKSIVSRNTSAHRDTGAISRHTTLSPLNRPNAPTRQFSGTLRATKSNNRHSTVSVESAGSHTPANTSTGDNNSTVASSASVQPVRDIGSSGRKGSGGGRNSIHRPNSGQSQRSELTADRA